LQNIIRTIAASRDQTSHDFYPDHIFISGIEDDSLNLTKFLKEKLEIPASPVTPELVLGSKAAADNSKTTEVRIANALSLSLMKSDQFGKLNFRKGVFGTKSKWLEHKSDLVRTGVLASVAFFIFVAALFYQNRILENRLNYLNRQINDIFSTNFPEIKRIVDPYKQMRIKVGEAEKNGSTTGYKHRETWAIDVLREISQRISREADVKVDRLVLGPDDAQFSGSADAFQSVNEIQNRLEEVPFFSKVSISSANQERTGNVVQFKIKAEF
jgi:hypothetical protein